MERVVYHDGFLPPPGAGTMCTAEEGKTRQSDRDASDINLTIKKYNLQPLEMVPGWSGKVGGYGDMTGIPSMAAMMERISVAREHFMQLPPEVRVLFKNDVALMLDAWDAGQMADVFKSIGWLVDKPVEPPAGAGAPSGPAPSA